MTERRRVAFVVHRYGRGGAERLCQALAERLATRHDVTVLTSCAIDHVTWANHFPAGETVENGVRLRRFAAVDERSPNFHELLGWVLSGRASRDDELAWLRAQGPHCPDLLAEIERDRERYDAIFFVTYLYEPTALGVHLAGDRAVLIPTAHDEPTIRLSIFRELFHAPRHIVFLVPAERRFVQGYFQNQHIPHDVCSYGMDPPPPTDPDGFRARLGIKGDLLVYVGRAEGAKGVPDLVDWVRAHPRAERLTLALLGQNVMGVPSAPPIVAPGFVSEQEKHDGLAAATVFVLPSQYESLSIVTMEAWQHGVPVLVNERSEVMLDHVRASQGGLYFRGQADFAACLNRLLDDPALRARLGRNGQRYVAANFTWQRVDATYERILESIAG